MFVGRGRFDPGARASPDYWQGTVGAAWQLIATFSSSCLVEDVETSTDLLPGASADRTRALRTPEYSTLGSMLTSDGQRVVDFKPGAVLCVDVQGRQMRVARLAVEFEERLAAGEGAR